MRKTNIYINRVLASLVLGGMVLSCTEPAAEKEAAYTHFFVTAEDVANPADENAPFGRMWSQGEEVAVWNGKTLSIFTSSQKNEGKTSLFFGETENTGNFLVCYPADDNAGAGEMTFEVPAKQQAVEGGISDESYVLVGKSDNNFVKLANMLGYVSVTIERENIVSMELETGNKAALAGTVAVSSSDLACTVKNAENSVELRGSGALKPGTYVFAVVPQTFAGYKVTFVAEGGQETALESSESVEVKAGKVAFLGDDAYLNASLSVVCEDPEVVQKGDQVVISVDSGNAGWTWALSSGCDWLDVAQENENSIVLQLNRTHLTAEDLTAEVTVTNDLNTSLTETVTVTLSSHLLFDARFNADGTAYDASKYERNIQTIPGDYMYTYFNKTADRYVARFNCTTPGGGRSTSYYRYDYGSDNEFKESLADNHSIECLCMMDQALDGSYNYEIKPFSSMQSGGTGFVVGKTNNANKLFFLPNTGSWTFADTKIVMEEGVYYHLIGTFDAASKETKVYVNGKLYGTFTNSSDTYKHPSATSQWFAIGGDPNGATSCGDGWRGDVVTAKIYDQVLSQDDVDILWKEANNGLPYSTVRYNVVFMGDSITQYWISANRGNPTFFTDNDWYNRGISGNTTADMLARFNYDLEQLAPKVMVFCGGTNDIAQNDGVFVSNEEILENIKTMVTRAEAVGTSVILCSLLPANKYYWSSAIENPSQEIKKVNEMIKAYAAEKGIPFVDYWTPLHDEADGMPEKYSSDGVHPNKDCYLVMQDIIKPVVTEVLSKLK